MRANGGKKSENYDLRGMVIIGNAAAQRALYNIKIRSIDNEIIRVAYDIKDLQLRFLDMGANVASVDIVGSPEEALDCRITGFHMPTFIARCAWISNDNSYVIEIHPNAVAAAINNKSRLEIVARHDFGDALGQ